MKRSKKLNKYLLRIKNFKRFFTYYDSSSYNPLYQQVEYENMEYEDRALLLLIDGVDPEVLLLDKTFREKLKNRCNLHGILIRL